MIFNSKTWSQWFPNLLRMRRSWLSHKIIFIRLQQFLRIYKLRKHLTPQYLQLPMCRTNHYGYHRQNGGFVSLVPSSIAVRYQCSQRVYVEPYFSLRSTDRFVMPMIVVFFLEFTTAKTRTWVRGTRRVWPPPRRGSKTLSSRHRIQFCFIFFFIFLALTSRRFTRGGRASRDVRADRKRIDRPDFRFRFRNSVYCHRKTPDSAGDPNFLIGTGGSRVTGPARRKVLHVTPARRIEVIFCCCCFFFSTLIPPVRNAVSTCAVVR